MSRLIRRLFAAVTNRSPRTRAARPQTSRLRLERMEVRDCPATNLAQVGNHLGQFIQDAAIVEAYQPTLYHSTIGQDLVRLYNDASYGTIQGLLGDFQTTYNHLAYEAQVTNYYHLDPRAALLANRVVYSEFVTVYYDMQAVAGAFSNFASSAGVSGGYGGYFYSTGGGGYSGLTTADYVPPQSSLNGLDGQDYPESPEAYYGVGVYGNLNAGFFDVAVGPRADPLVEAQLRRNRLLPQLVNDQALTNAAREQLQSGPLAHYLGFN